MPPSPKTHRMALSSPFLYKHLPLCLLIVLLQALPCPAAGGSWALLQKSTGVSAMHMQLLPTDHVVMFDRADFGQSDITLPKGKCNPKTKDCYAHSVEYDVEKNVIRPVYLETDLWCSSGALTAEGNLLQTGGWGEGSKVVRVYKSWDKKEWEERRFGLVEDRWYASNQLLPDGKIIIVGGRDKFSYEFYPKTPATQRAFNLPFLFQTKDPDENNLYPFTFLLPDGNLMIFANDRGILLDYSQNLLLKTYPPIPGGQPRNYPSSGSAVLLPFRMKGGDPTDVEVLICGGARKNSYNNALSGKFEKTLNTCGRIKVSDPNPQWVMDTMPMPRVMGDMVMLPNAHVLIINGAMSGCAGWQLGRDPATQPVIYRPDKKIGSRFEVQNPTAIPRMYHSTAILVRDGRVLVAGSNPNEKYTYKNVPYPTELRLEAYSPPYLDPSSAELRPYIINPSGKNLVAQHGKRMDIHFNVSRQVDPSMVSVTMVAPPFTTHTFSMSQRVLVLDNRSSTKPVGNNSYTYTVSVTMPSSANVAPPAYYLMHVVYKEVPSPGIWVKIQS